jgi:predicted nucleotidyltransferase
MVTGSFAAGRPSQSSDIDLLIVGDITRTEVESLLAPIAERHDRALDPIVLSDDEYRSRFAGSDYVLQASARSGLLLLGDPDLVEVQTGG